MADQLDPWEKKIKSKLEAFKSGAEVSDDKVNSFFDDLESGDLEKPSSGSYSTFLRFAAILIVALGVVFVVFRTSQVELSTGKGELSELLLPDGSRVVLRYQTALSYNKLLWNFSRNLKLEGEAFFEVEKGSKFTVNSNAGSTSVLGTSFNVLARKEKYEVKCFEGKVQVELDRAYILEPGDAVSKAENSVSESKFELNQSAWHQGEVYFDNEPLPQVVEELRNNFDIEVEVAEELSLDDYDYTGFFPTDNLQLALRLVFEPLGLKGKIEGEKRLFISKSDN